MKPSNKDLEFCKSNVSGVAAAAIDKMLADRSAPSTWQLSDIPKGAWIVGGLMPIIIGVIGFLAARISPAGGPLWPAIAVSIFFTIGAECMLFSKAIVIAESEARWRARSNKSQ